jgi:hypothetical protein
VEREPRGTPGPDHHHHHDHRRRGGFHVTSGASTFVTRDGLTGVLETYAAERTEGVIAALVVEGQGLQIQAVGPPAQLPGYASSIEDMIGSIARSGS